MDERPVKWDQANRRHLEVEHSERRITLEEIEQAMTDPNREEVPDPGHPGYWLVRGRTSVGRLLYVAWVEHLDGRYPVHAHAIGRRGR